MQYTQGGRDRAQKKQLVKRGFKAEKEAVASYVKGMCKEFKSFHKDPYKSNSCLDAEAV